MLTVRFAHEDAVAGEHVAALDERHHPRRDGFIIMMSPVCRAPHAGSVAGLGSAAAPLPLLGASAPPVRVSLPPDNRARSAWPVISIVVLSSHMTDHGERSYPQFVFTTSDELCARGVPFNTRSVQATATATSAPTACFAMTHAPPSPHHHDKQPGQHEEPGKIQDGLCQSDRPPHRSPDRTEQHQTALRPHPTHPAHPPGLGAQQASSSSSRVLHLDPRPWPATGRARRRDGIPASAPPVLRSGQPASCCPRAVSSGQQRSPTAHRGTRHPQLSAHHLAR
jgi:hypothetical protein